MGCPSSEMVGVGHQTGADLQGMDAVRRRTLAPRRRRRAPSQRETAPTTWTAVAQSSSAGSPRPWRRLPGSLYVMPTGNARPEKTRPQRRNGRRPSVLAVPPDEHAASPEQQSPKRRRDHERRSFQARISSPAASSEARTSRPSARSNRPSNARPEPSITAVRSSRSPSPASRRSQRVRPSAERFRWGLHRNSRPSHASGRLRRTSDNRQES
jgi:hypothetical protein